MVRNARVGKGCGWQPRGQKCPGNTLPCAGCAAWQDLNYDSMKNSRLRVAVVDSDPTTHEFVRQVLKACVTGWTLDSHLTPDSLLDALDGSPGATPEPSTTCDALHCNAPHYQLSTPPTTNYNAPDVVLLEAEWPDDSGPRRLRMDYARRLIARLPQPRLVMVTACADAAALVESLMAGALGYLTKPVAPGHLVWAISEVAQGRQVLSVQAQTALVDFVCRLGAARRPSRLTWRECEVMLLLVQGALPKAMSTKLGISEGTVNRHLHDIYDKLGVHSKTDAIRVFVGGGELLRSAWALTHVRSLYY